MEHLQQARDPLQTLADAKALVDALFFAENAFSLFESGALDGPGMSEADLLARLKRVLAADGLSVIERYLAARAAARGVMRTLRVKRRNATSQAVRDVLAKYATPMHDCGPGWYTFPDKSTGRAVSAKVLGIENFYYEPDGHAGGSLRVSPRGNGSSEPWAFRIEGNTLVVRSDDGL
jgi:hypothetical protein